MTAMTPVRAMVVAFALVALGLGPAAAHQQGNRLHLADAPLDQRIESIGYCKGTYSLVFKDGAPVEYPEFDLRFKTDSSVDGPAPGTPVVIKAGMRGDRGFVVFSSPEEIATFLKTTC